MKWHHLLYQGSLRRSFSYLQPLAPSLQGQTGLSPRLEALPAELQDMVFKNLHPLINPPQTCTRSLPARLWRDLLFYGLVLPWLWDWTYPPYRAALRHPMRWTFRHLKQKKSGMGRDLCEPLHKWTCSNRGNLWSMLPFACGIVGGSGDY